MTVGRSRADRLREPPGGDLERRKVGNRQQLLAIIVNLYYKAKVGDISKDIRPLLHSVVFRFYGSRRSSGTDNLVSPRAARAMQQHDLWEVAQDP